MASCTSGRSCPRLFEPAGRQTVAHGASRAESGRYCRLRPGVRMAIIGRISRSQKSFTSIRPVFNHLQLTSRGLMPASMLLLSWIRSLRSSQAFASFTFLARKRCFSGGTDTSRRLLRPCGTHRALPDGDRRKKRGIDFAIPKHTGVMPRWSTVSENPASNWGARRHPASLTLKMRFKSLAAARNWVRENPETRPATSPRAPAAATPSYHPDLTPYVSLILASGL